MNKNLFLVLSAMGLITLSACDSGSGTIPITPDPIVTPSSETGLCSDGTDNDGDSLTDCSDTDCTGDTACGNATAEVCNDTTDNDGDGAADCADTDCAADTTACPPSTTAEALCTDTLDDDADGAIDCADTDCAADAACASVPPVAGETLCNDLGDDDADGDMDCDDADCAGDAMCADADGDGFLANADCDDTKAEVNLDAREIIGNGIDEDCDGTEFSLTDTHIKWIRAEGGIDNAVCSIEQPCLTLGHVVKNVALDQKDSIAMIEGSYMMNHTIKVDRPINIIGAIYQDGETYKFDEENHATKIFTNSHALIIKSAGVSWDHDRVRMKGLDIHTEGAPSEFTIKDSSPALNHIKVRTERSENSNGAMLITGTAASGNMRVSIRNAKIQMGATYRNTPGAVMVTPISVVNLDGKLNLEIVNSAINTGDIGVASSSLAVGITALNVHPTSRMNLKLHNNVMHITTSDIGIGVMGNNISDASIRHNRIVIAKDTLIQNVISIKGRPAGAPEKLSVSDNLFKNHADTVPALVSFGVVSQNINTVLAGNTIGFEKSIIAVNASHQSAPGAGDKFKLINNVMLNDAATPVIFNLWTSGVIGTDFILKTVKNNDTFGGTGSFGYYDATAAVTYSDIPTFETYLNGLNADSATGNLSVDPLMSVDTTGETPVIVLDAASPLIDAGLTPAPATGREHPRKDINGNPRVTDGNGDGTKAIDIGAVEYQPATL